MQSINATRIVALDFRPRGRGRMEHGCYFKNLSIDTRKPADLLATLISTDQKICLASPEL
jgi:hypothetical protein